MPCEARGEAGEVTGCHRAFASMALQGGVKRDCTGVVCHLERDPVGDGAHDGAADRQGPVGGREHPLDHLPGEGENEVQASG